MEQLQAGCGTVGASYWNQPGRARRYSRTLDDRVERDPFLARLRRAAKRRSTVVDVGAGTGRFSLALAPRVQEVVAVDPSRAMLGVLARTARARGLTNVRRIESSWEDAPLAPAEGGLPRADLVFCSYVLPLVVDAEPFLTKMDAACQGRAFVYMNAWSSEGLYEPFWRHFHGRPRRPAPTYLDLAAILEDLGLVPEVEVVEVPLWARYPSMSAAVRDYRSVLVLPDTGEARAELRRLLAPWLVQDAGFLRPPMRTMPAAVVSWAAGAPP